MSTRAVSLYRGLTDADPAGMIRHPASNRAVRHAKAEPQAACAAAPLGNQGSNLNSLAPEASVLPIYTIPHCSRLPMKEFRENHFHQTSLHGVPYECDGNLRIPDRTSRSRPVPGPKTIS